MFKSIFQTAGIMLLIALFMIILPILLYVAAGIVAFGSSWFIFKVIREYNKELEAIKNVDK